MDKIINALGLMSGTSMDGIDASIISSDGENSIDIIGNSYLKYDSELKNSLKEFCEKINSKKDLKLNISEFLKLEREITIKHSELSSKMFKEHKSKVDIVGFHGQTIIHRPKDNYSIQMGNGKLLSQLLNKNVIYQFREKDIENGGEGAPLTPIYHHFIKKKLNLNKPVLFLNIGGISNCTYSNNDNFIAKDVGPGNCLMDMFIKKKLKKNYDKNGDLASSGKIDNVLVNNFLEHEIYTNNKNSYDIRDFDINFVRGLSIEDSLANLNYFTAKFITENIKKNFKENYSIILCGGGRKNKTLVNNLKKLLNISISNIDEYNIDGDFIESQAFAYLSIRSLYNKPISFPNTTGVKKPTSGGKLIVKLEREQIL
tara:strand:+ start:38 stop:1150 length:1113 start_codon:yes stop_codon:yes gene_type:complete